MKKIFGLLIVLSVLIAGCGQPAQPKIEVFSGSIEDLLARNKNLKCELVVQQDGQIMAGTTYIAGDQARSDFQLKISEQEIMTSHMINDGTWLYTWSDEYPAQAMKIKLETMQAEEFGNEEIQGEAENYGLDNYQADLDYKCYDWVKDSAMFIPPTGINFMDFSQMMEQLQKSLPSLQTGQADLCAQCDLIPDSQAQADCRQNLGCN